MSEKTTMTKNKIEINYSNSYFNPCFKSILVVSYQIWKKCICMRVYKQIFGLSSTFARNDFKNLKALFKHYFINDIYAYMHIRRTKLNSNYLKYFNCVIRRCIYITYNVMCLTIF